jgi:hypothetical protein
VNPQTAHVYLYFITPFLVNRLHRLVVPQFEVR